MKAKRHDRHFSGFAGEWFTTFGPMTLKARGASVTGTYESGAREGRISGATSGDTLKFDYSEPGESGAGRFRLARPGKFVGSYSVSGESRVRRWEGERGWDGVWSSDFGRMRLIHEPGRIHGFYEGPGPSVVDGALRKGRLELRYREPAASGEARFELQEGGRAFAGEWRADGRTEWLPWTGRRLPAERGLTWLVVLEAHWQRSLAESEYAFGDMLREVFARLPGVRVRQRFFHDAASHRALVPRAGLSARARDAGDREPWRRRGPVGPRRSDRHRAHRRKPALRGEPAAAPLLVLPGAAGRVARDRAAYLSRVRIHDTRRLGGERNARIHLSRPDAQPRAGAGGSGGTAADARHLRG